ncbi:MAG: adenine phosphoribosyltransferase [Planctomycetota bacterium]|nr:adenine phosphoribosyltransferase [Planctomycetota bacterium]MCX8040111.1 adenine phosphoribosyltransferase [Planctomycetota bacterium]MDW8373431.1 adenine phosphoribosyltransferase [Planctomycetota bacterium]
MDLASLIREVPDFPKPGIRFKDITPLLRDPRALQEAVQALAAPWRGQGVSAVLGIEARGFVFAPAVALALSAGFVPARKPGKLPCQTVQQRYGLEYGTDALEVHADALRPGERVLLIDDVLATGGTLAAACALAGRLGAQVVGCGVLIELCALGGRQRLAVPVASVIQA